MLDEMGKQGRQAARLLGRAPAEKRSAVLERLAFYLENVPQEVLAANALDIADGRQEGLSPAMIDRLMLNQERLAGMAADLRSVAAMPDPLGEVFDQSVLPNGLRVQRQRVPIGVLGVIYESRPNVTVDVAGLAIKTGNGAILRGGSETLRSNQALIALVHKALEENGLPADSVQLIAIPDRALVLELLQLHEYVDLIIPRGGAGLHAFCREHSKIPVITGGIGICHLYVDSSADLAAALPLIYNAKVQRPTVCNALDTLLVHPAVAGQILPAVVEHLQPAGVTFRADPAAAECLAQAGMNGDLLPGVSLAGKDDFDTEWLSLVLGLKVVDGLEEAIRHIATHSTGHSDGILTGDAENARRFVAEVDSAAVYVNASTRFTDGAQLGLGAEVAVSTQRLHARGPMGLRELTSYKWVISGDYHIRAG
jgi:glutamate-5-semialdehyde dehydrogenase